MNAWLSELEAHGAPPHGTRFFEALDGHVRIHFADIRDSCSTLAGIRLAEKGWKVDYTSPVRMAKVFASILFESLLQNASLCRLQDEAACREMTTCHIGQVLVLAAVPQDTAADVVQAMETVQTSPISRSPLRICQALHVPKRIL